MLAMNYRGPYRVRVSQKSLPETEHPNDAIVRVTRSCICGSDLHTYHGLVPDTRVGTTFGHEFIGVVEEVGSSVTKLEVGDHVLVPFNIACGQCAFCKQELYGNCHEANPAATAVGGFFGYSHTAGGFDGGQAEYVRMPYADVSPTIIPPDIDADNAVLLTDVFPTGYLADRINVVEGLINDLKRGHIPNIFAERGMKADWKYNRKELVRNIAIATIITTGLIMYLRRKKSAH